MNIGVLIAEALVFTALFTVGVFAAAWGDRKNSPGYVHNCPPDIQEAYFKTHPRMEVGYGSKKVVLTKLAGLLLFVAILSACAWLAGARTFLQGFGVGLGLMVWIGLFDTLFLDWVLFANMRYFRLEGTEHMDEAYHQKWFHLKGMLFPGSVFGLIVGALVGAIIALLA